MVWGSLSQNYRGLYVVFYKTLTIGTKACVVQECPNQAVLT